MEFKALDENLICRANNNSMMGKRGDLSKSGYESYCQKVIGWNISDEKKRKILDKLHEKWSEILKYEAQHVSVAVAGPARYNSKKLDKSDKILELSHEFVEWFKGLENQVKESSFSNDKAKRLEEMVLFCHERPELNPTNHLAELAMYDTAKFTELYEKLYPEYRWRKNSTIAKLYQKAQAGEIKEIKKEVFFQDENLTAYTEGERAFIKFVMKPQRQLIVALKSRKWFWNSNHSAWSNYLDRVDREWISSISERYAKYV